jgi:glutathione S-transferase
MLPAMPPRLITIPVSHYCDKARWALDRQGVAYVEDGHVPLLHWIPLRRAGGERTVPYLVDDDAAHDSSWRIVAYADARRGDRPTLLPPAHLDEITTLCAGFDDHLGPHTRRFAYHAVLPSRRVTVSVIGAQVPALERAVMSVVFPIARAMLRRALKIDEAGVERSRVKIDATFADVEARLADGRRYLVGDTFTAADLTFASLAAPILMPPEYPSPWPAWDALPARSMTEMRAWRARPAGAFALRMYATERGRPV